MVSLDDFLNAATVGGYGVGKSLYGTATGQGIKGNQQAAGSNIDEAKADFGALTPPSFNPVSYQGPTAAPDAQAVTEGPSAMGSIATDPSNVNAQKAQLAALSNLAARGGRSAATDANLAQIQANENQNAKGQREAILASAAARGQGGSGASLLAQLQGSQSAIDRQSAEDQGVAGQEANTAIGAGQAAAGIGAGLENQEFGEAASKAAAADAVSRFNAGNMTGVNEFNTQKNQGVNNATSEAYNAGQTMNNFQMPQQAYEDQYQQAAGKSGAAIAGTNYYGGQANAGTQAQGNLFGAGAKLGTTLAGQASKGGRVTGPTVVPGDSPLNDIVPVNTEAGETIVPKDLSAHGTPKQISDFVKNAAPIEPKTPQQQQEAKLSALKNIAKKRRFAA